MAPTVVDAMVAARPGLLRSECDDPALVGTDSGCVDHGDDSDGLLGGHWRCCLTPDGLGELFVVRLPAALFGRNRSVARFVGQRSPVLGRLASPACWVVVGTQPRRNRVRLYVGAGRSVAAAGSG